MLNWLMMKIILHRTCMCDFFFEELFLEKLWHFENVPSNILEPMPGGFHPPRAPRSDFPSILHFWTVIWDTRIPRYHVFFWRIATSLVTNGPAIGHFFNPGIANSIHNDVLSIITTIPSHTGHGEAATMVLEIRAIFSYVFTEMFMIWANFRQP